MKGKILKKGLVMFAGIVTIFILVANKTWESGGQVAKRPAYLNTAYSFQERAADLVSRMTPEEKQSQLGNTMHSHSATGS